MEAERGGACRPARDAAAGGGASLLDHDNAAGDRWHVDGSSHREREAESRIRPQDVPPGKVVLPADAFQGVSVGDEMHDRSAAYQRRGWNGNRFDDDAVTAQGHVADRGGLVSGWSVGGRRMEG